MSDRRAASDAQNLFDRAHAEFGGADLPVAGGGAPKSDVINANPAKPGNPAHPANPANPANPAMATLIPRSAHVRLAWRY